MPRTRTSASRACRTTLEFVAVFRKNRVPVKKFSFCSPGVALLASSATWTCMRWIHPAGTVWRCTSAHEFSCE